MPDAVDLTTFQPVRHGFSAVISRSGPWLLREPRSSEAQRRQDHEADVLAAVADALPVEVPIVESRIPPSPERPYGAHLVRWLEGDEVDRTVAPESVARFLETLHGLDSATTRGLLPTFAEWCQQQRKLETAGLAALTGRIEDRLLAELARLMNRLGDRIADCPRPGVVHGDLWYGNMLMRDHRLTGVLDWEFAAIGDPLVDYAALWYLGDDFMATLLAEQSVADLPETVQYYRVLREFAGLTWSIDNHDEQELRESVAKVTNVAGLVLS
ncbi:phosphotransferase family protein [Kribbella sp. CA-253562]|uniref:phosphotransferase family protein n=1 Tax=Kribbella sp. CA-253562 TaxID=3239942 RepID=UPI003D8B75CD